MSVIDKLHEIKRLSGHAQTKGLTDEMLVSFLETDPKLTGAINSAYLVFQQYFSNETLKPLLMKAEHELINALQSGLINFYDEDSINPYVPLAASGPWVITSHGAVLHDSGGYGMLALGQNPSALISQLDNNQTIANVMTASFSQKKMVDALTLEIGCSRKDKGNPYEFLFLNSGSEGLTLACRLSDLNAHNQTKKGAKHSGKTCRFISLKGSFHGRTDRPAQVSDSCQAIYKSSLHSFQSRNNLMTVMPNNIDELVQAFKSADEEGVFIESMFMEPVMGEGDPGLNINAEFYAKARELTKKHGSLLIVDSVQAGFRTTGYLSLIDYPGFREFASPDIEVFSKAINGGQYPLSVIGLNQKVKSFFKIGLYGNTMSANPRALDVSVAVLNAMTDNVRENIQNKGIEMLEKFSLLQQRFPDIITKVQGTGLLCSLSINPKKADVIGRYGLERQLRENGIGVIHGGKNALRFTPHFSLTSQEVDLIVTELTRVMEPLMPHASHYQTAHQIQEEKA